MFWLLAFLIYWLVLFVACYTVVEYGQTYYYEEKTAGAALRVAGGSLILAILWTRRSVLQVFPPRVERWYDQFFTADIAAWLLLIAIVSFVIFTLLFQFHPRHAVYLGPLTVLIVGGMASIAAASIARPGGTPPPEIRVPSKPVRKAAGGVPPAVTKEVAPAAQK
jgi:hypothetical protein